MDTLTAPINNRLVGDILLSDLVYPIEHGYYYDVEVSKEWIEEKLQLTFYKRGLRIANKYAIELKVNSGRTVLVVNHDGKHYLIQKAINQ